MQKPARASQIVKVTMPDMASRQAEQNAHYPSLDAAALLSQARCALVPQVRNSQLGGKHLLMRLQVQAPFGSCGYHDVRRIRTMTRLLEALYDWLSPSDSVGSSDLIFVLAGRQSRKGYALELFRQGMASNLLLSVGSLEIRKFNQLSWPPEIDLAQVAGPTPAITRQYFVSVESGKTEVELIPRGRFGTLSEIRALAAWLQRRPNIRSLVIVSSGPHLRRVRACCRALLPERVQLRFLATPNEGWLTRRGWWRNRRCRRLVEKELGKLFIYRLLLMGHTGSLKLRCLRRQK